MPGIKGRLGSPPTLTRVPGSTRFDSSKDESPPAGAAPQTGTVASKRPAVQPHAAIGVVILHAHEIARQGLRAMLSSLPEVHLAGCASCMALACEAAKEAAAQVLIVPTTLDASDLVSLAEVRSNGVRILALVTGESTESLSVAAAVDADGYVMEKTATVEELHQAIRQILNDQIPLPAQLAKHLLGRARYERDPELRTLNLTPRERQVLGLLADGLSNKEIARRLGISDNGAKRHVASILTKLHCPNRAGAVSKALARGVIGTSAFDTAPA